MEVVQYLLLDRILKRILTTDNTKKKPKVVGNDTIEKINA